MLTMTDAILFAMTTPGAVATAFVEFKTGRTVAGFGEEHVDFDRLTPAWTEMLLTQFSLAHEQGTSGGVIDMVITTQQRYHILRPLRAQNCSDMYLYLVVEKQVGSIPMAWLQLSKIEENLVM